MVLIFAIAIAFILYVMAGYPVILGLLSRFFPKAVVKSGRLETVSVIIPVHNGARFIRAKLESVLGLNYPKELIEVFVVSDGSTDQTHEIVREFVSSRVHLIRIPRGGKPAALNSVIPRAQGDILLLTDVRQELEPESLRRLVACFGDQSVGVVSGEMIIRRGDSAEQANVGLYWRYESWIRDQLGHIDSMFGATGPFYAIRRNLAVVVPPEILLDDVYMPLAAFFRGYRLIVEKSAKAFDYPTTLRNEFTRKVRTLAGNYQLLVAMPRLLGPGNRMWFHFMSYKVGRLLLPYALAAVAVSSFFLPGPFAMLALSAQGVFYGLALGDRFIPERIILKKISSPACTFLTMMVAVVCALSVFFVNPRSLWKQTHVSLSGVQDVVEVVES